jgi:predicted transcriptional regulator
MTTAQDTAALRAKVAASGSYDIHIEIDVDCEELVDACGLEYERSDQDDTQNVIIISLNSDEFEDVQHDCNFNYANEQDVATTLLNPELGEYTTKVTIYKPSGDIISFS